MQAILDELYVLAQYFFTTSEMELTYYHQKVNVRVDELPNDLRQVNKLKKISKMSTKKQILTVVLENFEESALKTFIEDFLLYFT